MSIYIYSYINHHLFKYVNTSYFTWINVLNGVAPLRLLAVCCRLTVEWDADHRDCADLRGGGSLFAASCEAYGPWACQRDS